MASTAFRSRVRRFLVALTLFTVGPMTLPGGPLHVDRVLVLAGELAAAATSTSSRATAREIPLTTRASSDASRVHDLVGASCSASVVVTVTGVR